ncbi:unnamed protein product [Pleuronectes platessa]|uniref:Uncharacterized protein n=1 Tax=Pleuronectes platessa TaxID=8262 RepID=A0A9N7YIG8_PLEPL|nr:unnamed protein product [Pleuronectes platessa]
MDVWREDWRDECKIWLDVMSGDRKDEERAECWRETGADGGMEEPSINNEIGLICEGVGRGHRGGKWGEPVHCGTGTPGDFEGLWFPQENAVWNLPTIVPICLIFPFALLPSQLSVSGPI